MSNSNHHAVRINVVEGAGDRTPPEPAAPHILPTALPSSASIPIPSATRGGHARNFSASSFESNASSMGSGYTSSSSPPTSIDSHGHVASACPSHSSSETPAPTPSPRFPTLPKPAAAPSAPGSADNEVLRQTVALPQADPFAPRGKVSSTSMQGLQLKPDLIDFVIDLNVHHTTPGQNIPDGVATWDKRRTLRLVFPPELGWLPVMVQHKTGGAVRIADVVKSIQAVCNDAKQGGKEPMWKAGREVLPERYRYLQGFDLIDERSCMPCFRYQPPSN